MKTAKPPDEKNNTQAAAEPPVTETPARPAGGITTNHDAEGGQPKAAAQAPATPPAKETPAASKDPKRAKLGAEDDPPDDADEVVLPSKAFKERIDRAGKASRKALFEKLGVKDDTELEAKLAALKEHDAKAEEARVAQLSKEEKLAEEKLAAETQRDEWKQKYEQQLYSQQVGEAQNHVARIFERHIDGDFVEAEMGRFQKHLAANYTKEELADLPDSAIEDWVKERVAKKPKLGLEGGKPAPEMRKVTTGVKNDGKDNPPPKQEAGGAKDYRPKPGETADERRAVQDRIRKETGISF